ncbi:MAG: hypothetical protein ACOX16_03135 [Candidatus Izemoplasmatales bacterium]|jgi:hypothetical protein
MNCIDNINRTPIPSDIFMSTLKLYYQLGRNEVYQQLFKNDFARIREQNAYLEATAFFRAFFPSFKVSDARLRSLRLSSTVAKNKAEVQYKNIIAIFLMIHERSSQPFHLNVTEINDLTKLLFKNVLSPEKLQYRKLERQRPSLIASDSLSLREQLEELIRKVQEVKKQGNSEPLFLYLNFMVDFMNMEIYKHDQNDVVALLVFYIMMLQEGIIVASYLSFFAKLLLNLDEYSKLLDKTRFGWSEGFSEIMPLARFMIRMYHQLYLELRDYARDYEYESQLEISKSDYIENTIGKLPEVFQKADIRLKHPFISDSTINRTLKRLQEENKIRPLGTGRSAKWIKLYHKETNKYSPEQLGLDLGD